MRWLLPVVVAAAWSAATLLAAPGTGGEVAFYSDRAGGGGSGADLYVMNGDGTHVRRLTYGRVAHEGEFDSLSAVGVDPPHWSPDRRKILFAGSRDGIYVVGADGKGQRRLATNAYLPEWSPDGKQILFTRGRGNSVDLWVMRSNGSGQRRLAKDGLWSEWSPTGRTIAFLRFRGKAAFRGPADLWMMKPDGNEQRRLAKNAFDVDWSPNGRWISFTRQEGGLVSIYLIRERGRERRLVKDSSGVTLVAWSPGGRQLAYVGQHGLKKDIAVVGIDGSKRRWLTNDGADEAFLAWSSDGQRVVFTINFVANPNVRRGFELFSVSARGGDRQRLTRTRANDVAPSFKPTR
jgi:Tol biopolymer transport system component